METVFFFTAVVRQLAMFNEQMEGHCTLLGLEKNDEEESETLRTLFVNEVTDKITYCKV